MTYFSSKPVTSVIFDLGGVIIDLHESKTTEAFALLSGKGISEIMQAMAHPVFHQFEKGLAGASLFRETVRDVLSIEADDARIDEAWNAMLGAIPPDRIQLLKDLRKKYSLFLLSNTNEIHFAAFNEIVQKLTGAPSLDDYFDKAYYSHHIGMRKPDREIFETVLTDNNLEADQTLFLDDNELNINGAANVGIQTIQIKYPDQILEIFK